MMNYDELSVRFPYMSKTEQRKAMKDIMMDPDLDYKETMLTLSFFVQKSSLSPFEKRRKLRDHPTVLKSKCVDYCRANNIRVKRVRISFHRCYVIENLSDPDNPFDTAFCLPSHRGMLKYLSRAV